MKKKVIASLTALFVAVSLCVSLVASAVITEATILITATKFISDVALAVALKDKDTDSNKNVGAVYADTVAIDYSKKSNDTIYTCPVYSLYGKTRFNYSNGNYEVISLHINIASFSSFYNNQPNNYLPSEYPLYEGKFPSCGTAVYIRTAYDSSDTILYSRTFAYIYDSMPIVLLFNSADSIGFSPTSNGKGTYWSWNGNGTPYNSMTNNRAFKVSNTNSIIARTGLDWDSRYSDFDFIVGNYSLVTYYTTEVYSNDSNFINNVNNRYDSLNYGTGFKPVMKKIGIEAKTTINNTNINNFNDYGLTYTNNEYIFNHTTYENNFNVVDMPAIKTNWNELYISQPDVGVSFDSDVRFNYVSLTAVPSSGSSGLPAEWLETYPKKVPESYIIITTVPTSPALPSINTDVIEVGKSYIGVASDIYNQFSDLYNILIFGLILGFAVFIFKR